MIVGPSDINTSGQPANMSSAVNQPTATAGGNQVEKANKGIGKERVKNVVKKIGMLLGGIVGVPIAILPIIGILAFKRRTISSSVLLAAQWLGKEGSLKSRLIGEIPKLEQDPHREDFEVKVNEKVTLEGSIKVPSSVGDNHQLANDFPTVVFFCQNGVSYQEQINEIGKEYNDRGFNVVMFNYRGVANSRNEGERPSAQDLINDGDAVVKELFEGKIPLTGQVPGQKREYLKAPSEELVLFHGESLGGGIAALCADNRQLAGRILSRTFTKFEDAIDSSVNNSFKSSKAGYQSGRIRDALSRAVSKFGRWYTKPYVSGLDTQKKLESLKRRCQVIVERTELDGIISGTAQLRIPSESVADEDDRSQLSDKFSQRTVTYQNQAIIPSLIDHDFSVIDLSESEGSQPEVQQEDGWAVKEEKIPQQTFCQSLDGAYERVFTKDQKFKHMHDIPISERKELDCLVRLMKIKSMIQSANEALSKEMNANLEELAGILRDNSLSDTFRQDIENQLEAMKRKWQEYQITTLENLAEEIESPEKVEKEKVFRLVEIKNQLEATLKRIDPNEENTIRNRLRILKESPQFQEILLREMVARDTSALGVKEIKKHRGECVAIFLKHEEGQSKNQGLFPEEKLRALQEEWLKKQIKELTDFKAIDQEAYEPETGISIRDNIKQKKGIKNLHSTVKNFFQKIPNGKFADLEKEFSELSNELKPSL
ncbi:MAG: hypothetical protein WB791_07995 [Waddliaceae bacterium]